MCVVCVCVCKSEGTSSEVFLPKGPSGITSSPKIHTPRQSWATLVYRPYLDHVHQWNHQTNLKENTYVPQTNSVICAFKQQLCCLVFALTAAWELASGWLLDSSGRSLQYVVVFSSTFTRLNGLSNRTSWWEHLHYKGSPQSLLLLRVDLSRVKLPFASRPCCATHKTVPGEHHPPVKLFHVTGKAWGCWLSSLCYWEVSKGLVLGSCIINKRQALVCLFICDWRLLEHCT